MDINQLYYFSVLCEEMNYTKASERLFISRQALMKSIHKLEDEFGYPLFYVTKNRLSLAPFGQHLLTEGKPIVDAFQEMSGSLVASFEQGCQAIPVRLSSCILPFVMPKLPEYLAAFQRAYPEVKLDISEFYDDRIRTVKDLDEGVYILLRMPGRILENLPDHGNQIFMSTLQSEELMLHVNKENPLSRQDHVSLSDLGDALFCAPGDPDIYFYDLNQAYRRVNGHGMNYRLCRDGGEALTMVRGNDLLSLGINFSTQPGVQSVPYSTKLLSFKNCDFKLDVILVCRADYARRPLVQLLIQDLCHRGRS